MPQMGLSTEMRSFLEEVAALELNAISEKDLKKGRRVGAGSFSVVSEARLQTQGMTQNKAVALKELRSDRHSFKVQQQQLLSEAAVLDRLHHKNIIRYIGCGVSVQLKKPSLFMVQEYLSGGSLDEYISRLRRRRVEYDPRMSYSLKTGLRWARQVAGAVDYLHSPEIGIVHRDIKLGNLLLTERSVERANVKLADFGLAADTTGIKSVPKTNVRITSWKYLSLSKQTKKKISPWTEIEKHTRRCFDTSLKPCTSWLKRSPSTDSALQIETTDSYYDLTEETGSYMYMSPEVWLGLPYNEKADIYSLGVIIAEILTGKPFSCCLLPEKSYEEAKNFCYCVANGLQLKCPKHFPRALATVLDACWDPDPARRPSARAVYEALEDYSATLLTPQKLPLFHPMSLTSMQKFKLNVARIKSACFASNTVD